MSRSSTSAYQNSLGNFGHEASMKQTEKKPGLTNFKAISNDNSASTDLQWIEAGENNKSGNWGNQHRSQDSPFPLVICRNN